MATLLLSAAGAAAASALAPGAGPVGAAVGRAGGAFLGALIDQRLLGSGARAVETPPLERIRVLGSREGAPIPRLFGRQRLAGQVIWAAPFTVRTERVGGQGKGGAPRAPSATRRSYAASFAVALCEGPADRIGRVWADGALLGPGVEMRFHDGAVDQPPDPLIAAVEGEGRAPAYRGVAYLVIETLDLAPFGNRVPQINVEVFRRPRPSPAAAPDQPPPLSELVRAVSLAPGTGEFSLATEPVFRRLGPGRSVAENRNTVDDRADIHVALDQLEEEAPHCEAVSLIVSWFGDDLRCGRCRVRPGVEERDKTTEPRTWRVADQTRAAAHLVGRDGAGRPIYGGTPSDDAVVDAIRELRARGRFVTFYPFLLMDVPPGSGLPDPYGAAEQPAHPWRGRITLDAAPGRPGSTDRTPAAADDVDAFFGRARPGDFARDGTRMRYSGPDEWSWRRMILHYAHLCAAAGGVDAFLIGSELRGVTQIRSGPSEYPAVAALKALTRDVRAILGPHVKIGYAADWSEYFGHHPVDGSGDVFFHLDPLWADPDVDFVGIDNYMPLSDWRDGPDHLDRAAARSPYALDYLEAGVEGGEGFDWHYPDDAARRAQARAPIADGAHGEDWLFRFKDLRNWWSRPHHDRPGGVRAAEPTGWVPMSKPIWFTEIGCGAVDKGANQPNVFHDPKSSESAAPHFSSGAPDEHMQRRFLQAALSYWDEPGRNPVSPLYGAPMIDTARTHVWTWDARPWPDFPARTEIWSDGVNHRLGHWINGRLGAADLALTVAEICEAAGLSEIDVSELEGALDGYAIADLASARAALQPLMLAFGFDGVESGGRVRFRPRAGAPEIAVTAEEFVVEPSEPPAAVAATIAREPVSDAPAVVRLDFSDAEGDYRPTSVERLTGETGSRRVERIETPLALRRDVARGIVDRWAAESAAAREEIRLALAPARVAVEPGDLLRFDAAPARGLWRVERIVDAGAREIVARRVPRAEALAGVARAADPVPLPPLPARQPLEVVIVDAPRPGARSTAPLLALFADPWPGAAAIYGSWGEDGFSLDAVADAPAAIGALAADAPGAAPWRRSRGAGLRVRLYGGALASAGAAAFRAGANLAALECADGGWEVLQFETAELVGPREYRLDGLLRGQCGTEDRIAPLAKAGARFALLDGAPVEAPGLEGLLGAPRTYRVVSAEAAMDDPSARALSVAATGAPLRPLAPCRLRAARGESGVALDWTRRSRRDADTWSGPDAPLDQPRERYRVRLVDGAGALLREVETERCAFLYADADAAADGDAARVARVAQLSDETGPGPEAEVSLDV